MRRYMAVGLGLFLGVAVACTGNGTASAPAKQPAELPGSDLSVTQALKAGNLMFVVLCEAQDDPRVATGRDDGIVEAMQSFRVVMALDAGMRTGETLRLRYWCHRARGRQERTIQKGERVIWFVGLTEKDGRVGIKAMDHTLENQLAATRPQAHLKLPVRQWGQAVEGLQCGIDPRGNAILLAVTNVSPKPVSIGYLMKTDKEGVLPTPSLTLEMKDSEGQFVPRINSATVKISGPGIALNPGWFCVHFFDVRQYFAVKESGQYLLTARIEKFPVRGPQTQIHTISLVSGEATLLVDMAKPQTPAEGPRVHAFAPRGEAAPATQAAIQPTQPEDAGTLHGRALLNGRPVSGVEIRVYARGNQQSLGKTETDVDGRFEVKRLPVGIELNLVANKLRDDFWLLKASANATIRPGVACELGNITLGATPPPISTPDTPPIGPRPPSATPATMPGS